MGLGLGLGEDRSSMNVRLALLGLREGVGHVVLGIEVVRSSMSVCLMHTRCLLEKEPRRMNLH